MSAAVLAGRSGVRGHRPPEGGTTCGVLVQFRTSFEKRPVGMEDVTLGQDAGGARQVIGYVIS